MANAVLPLFWPLLTAFKYGFCVFFAGKLGKGSKRGLWRNLRRNDGAAADRRVSYRVRIAFLGRGVAVRVRIFAAGSQASKTQFCGSFFKAFERVDLVFVCVRQRRR